MIKQIPQRPHLLKIIPPLENSIVIKGDEISWSNPWHYHPEIEILYCIKGKGTNFIGNSIRTIEEGELLVLGKNLPHTRQRDREYYLKNPFETPESIVIQFRDDFLGDRFFDLREFAHIRRMLNTAALGLKFFGNTLARVTQRLHNIVEMDGTASVLELLAILDTLARSEEFIKLNSVSYVNDVHEKASQKINKVYHFTIEHFREPISLKEVASLTDHSTSAFCRYFKTRTRKSYFQYLTEIRIGYACEMLREGNMDVTRVCFASGFNNLSNFNKQFKKIMKMTPSDYRNQSLRKIPATS
jgi:AraC-like DNA-binding protein